MWTGAKFVDGGKAWREFVKLHFRLFSHLLWDIMFVFLFRKK